MNYTHTVIHYHRLHIRWSIGQRNPLCVQGSCINFLTCLTRAFELVYAQRVQAAVFGSPRTSIDVDMLLTLVPKPETWWRKPKKGKKSWTFFIVRVTYFLFPSCTLHYTIDGLRPNSWPERLNAENIYVLKKVMIGDHDHQSHSHPTFFYTYNPDFFSVGLKSYFPDSNFSSPKTQNCKDCQNCDLDVAKEWMEWFGMEFPVGINLLAFHT